MFYWPHKIPSSEYNIQMDIYERSHRKFRVTLLMHKQNEK